MSESIGNLFIYNGEILEGKNFSEDILNRGKALYEVIRVIGGVPLFFERHMMRLNNSFELTGHKLWVSLDTINESIGKLISANSLSEGNIKIVFNLQKYDDKLIQNYAVYIVEHHYPHGEDYEKGVSTILYYGERNTPNVKVVNSDFRKSVDEEIKKANAYEAILVDRNGIITEGSKSNIFLIKGDKVVTAPLELVLPGVTRSLIIDICNEEGIEVIEQKVDCRDIKYFDALFISGTSPKVLPVRNVDDMIFYSSENKVVKIIKTAYDKTIERYMKNNVVNL
jgi:branched-chain amino acid aminotransferase